MPVPAHPRFPKLHNALWPGVVGKGPGLEPCLGLEEMLRLTAEAEVNGTRFNGVDLFLASPHVDIGSGEEQRIADTVAAHGLVVGSLVAPVWPATGGGSAMGSQEERGRFLQQVRKSCEMGASLKRTGIRRYGVIRIDSADTPAAWCSDPAGNTHLLVATLREACHIAADHGERLALEGEICWGGMHSWSHVADLLEAVGRPDALGFQADMAHVLLFALGYNAPEHRLLPPDFDWKNERALDDALKHIAGVLRPWTLDFHVAQNDATVKGAGSHDKTGRHCVPYDPSGKLDIVRHSGFWLRDDDGKPTRTLQHICWDGCMFPNSVMQDRTTWNSILAAMLAVRDAHGWNAAEGEAAT